MSRAHSISTQRPYGTARVCDVWKVPRATVYRYRASGTAAANETQPPRRRGPTGAASDRVLLEKNPRRHRVIALLRGRLPEDLGAAEGFGHPHRGPSRAADHEGERPSGPAPSGPAGRLRP